MPTEQRTRRGCAHLGPTIVGALSIIAACIASGAGFEDLLSPGDLSAAHAKLDGQCDECHQAMKRESETPLCLACHEEVQEDLRSKQGHHGRSTTARGAPCRSCHPEHRGRDADVLGLGRSTFDHGLTDFPLEGAHRRPACTSCHEPEKKYREAPADCGSCHSDDDAHRGSLGEDCGSCHEPARWAEASFDHAKTDFALEGKHVEVECGLCHGVSAYDQTPSSCQGCHRVDDVHRGRLGDGCKDCHTAADWSRTSFDHARDAKFTLRGAHEVAKCESCHIEARQAPAKDCSGCHTSDDVHRGARGSDCQRCHAEDRWSTKRFDHEAEARWPLLGLHGDKPCASCHVDGIEAKLDKRCSGCHESEDVHAGQLGRDCESCHHPAGWVRELEFDHDLKTFPLLGLHAMVACEECHSSQRYHDTPTECARCHPRDDTHEGRLGDDCRSCHNPNGWPIWRFDHATSTRFALDGRHEDLRCRACHQRASSGAPRIASTCTSCHRRDDPHRGGFGAECQGCHSAESWGAVHFGAPRRAPGPEKKGE